VGACSKTISKLQARHCELSNDDKRNMASGMTKNYDAWDRFFRDLADTVAVCMWDKQPDFRDSCNER
jgi:hypothetical protein